uniref:Uncharacterized protein n=1 Tax=Rhizophora mucronata TaxID=61149 RepID=A0A2P2K2U0_RHIMU
MLNTVSSKSSFTTNMLHSNLGGRTRSSREHEACWRHRCRRSVSQTSRPHPSPRVGSEIGKVET